MRKQENRSVTVLYCDGCGEEMTYLERCATCKKEYCMEDGGKKHFAFGVELYRYKDAQRLHSQICNGCTASKSDLTVRALLDGMMAKTPVPMTVAAE